MKHRPTVLSVAVAALTLPFVPSALATDVVPLTQEVKDQARTAQGRDCLGFDRARFDELPSQARQAYLQARCLLDGEWEWDYPVLVYRGLSTGECMRQAVRWRLDTGIAASCVSRIATVYADPAAMP